VTKIPDIVLRTVSAVACVPVDHINPEAPLADFKCDLLDVIDIAARLEYALDLSAFSDDQVKLWETVGDITTAVNLQPAFQGVKPDERTEP